MLSRKIREMCKFLPFLDGTEASLSSRLGANGLYASRRLEFSVVFTPYDLFCLASLVVARGLADDAFDPSFDSVEDLLQRPLMEKHIQSIDLPWKKELEDKQIFPLSYRDYWEIFNRTLLVAGYPESIRPYAVRVGAGGRLDGICSWPFSNPP